MESGRPPQSRKGKGCSDTQRQSAALLSAARGRGRGYQAQGAGGNGQNISSSSTFRGRGNTPSSAKPDLKRTVLLSIRRLSGQTFALEADATDDIKRVKAQIARQEVSGALLDLQLRCGLDVLPDSQLISDIKCTTLQLLASRFASVATGSADGTIRLWSSEVQTCPSEGKRLLTIQVHKNCDAMVTSILRTEDDRLVSGSSDGSLRIWNMRGDCLGPVSKGSGEAVHALAQLDSTCFASGSDDGSIRLWSLDTGGLLRILVESEYPCKMRALQVLDGDLIASGSSDGQVRIYSTKLPQAPSEGWRIFQGHTHAVHALALICDDRIASGSEDWTVRVWNLSDGECVSVLAGHTQAVQAVAHIEGDDERLASGSRDLSVRIWSLANGVCLAVLDAVGYGLLNGGSLGDISWALAYLGGERLASGAGSLVHIWNLETAKLAEVRKGHLSPVTCMCVV